MLRPSHDTVNLLNQSDLTAMATTRHRGELYLDELLQECARAVQVLGRRREVVVQVTTPHEIPFTGDEALLRQMCLNLLDNAVRHASSPGRVDVVVDQADSDVTVVITDSGSGIAPKDQERIFERFVSIDTAGRRGGGGLGLPIARWIAQAHGGSLRAEPSEHGGRLVAVLPLHPTDTP